MGIIFGKLPLSIPCHGPNFLERFSSAAERGGRAAGVFENSLVYKDGSDECALKIQKIMSKDFGQ